MDENKTKQAFANICERIWKQILSEDELEPEIEASMRRVVAQLTMIAWNTCNVCESLSEAKDKVAAFARQVYPECDSAANPLLNAVSIKWHDYGDDRTLIASATVEIVDGRHRAVAYLKGELPEAESATDAFRSYMESPEVRARLRDTPPEKLSEEMGRIVAEYNADLPPVPDKDRKRVSPKNKKPPKDIGRAKEHFAKYCEVFWKATLEGMDLDAEQEAHAREVIMQLLASAWNAHAVTGNLVDASNAVKEYNREVFDGNKAFLKILRDAVVYKDLHFADDTIPVADTAIEIVEEKPRAVAFFEGEKRGSSND